MLVPTENEARHLLSGKLFGVEEWHNHFPGQLEIFTERQQIPPFPWETNILHEPCPFSHEQVVADTHIAFLGVRGVDGHLASLDWLRKQHARFWYKDIPLHYYGAEYLSSRTCYLRWYLMPTTPPAFVHEVDQCPPNFPPEYEQAFAIEEACKMVFYRKLFGVFPTDSKPMKCLDVLPANGMNAGYLLVKTIQEYDLINLGSSSNYRRFRIPFGFAVSRELPK